MSLNSTYSALYNAQLNPYAQERDSAIQSANQNINSVNNQYKNMYAALDRQTKQAGDTKYKGLNDADTTVNQNLNRIQDIMAKNGWLGGGENLQAQLDSNSDRSNRHGELEDKYSTTLENIDTQRNQDQSEQNLKLQALYDAIQSAKDNYAKNAAALEQNLYAKQLSDQETAARVASSSAISNSNGNDLTQMAWEELQRQYANGNFRGSASWLAQNRDALINSIGQTEYNKMGQALTPAQKSYNQQRSSQTFDRRSSPW